MSDTLSHLEARRTELLQQQRLRELEAEVQLLETDARQVEPDPWLLSEEWGQRLSSEEHLGEFGWGASIGEIDDVNSRAGGAERPVIETELQLAVIRGRARRICQEIPAAIGALRNLTNYVIGTSWSYVVTPRDQVAAPLDVVAAVQSRLDRFLDESHWVGCKDRETFRRCVRDGEAFLRLKLDSFGNPSVRFVEPAHVTEPRDPADLEAWLGRARSVRQLVDLGHPYQARRCDLPPGLPCGVGWHWQFVGLPLNRRIASHQSRHGRKC